MTDDVEVVEITPHNTKQVKTSELAKRKAALRSRSQSAKCKNCKVRCPFQKNLLSKNKESLCVVPDARAESILYDLPIVSEELLKKFSIETLEMLRGFAEDSYDLKRFFDSVLAMKREFYPNVSVSKNLNVNVDVELVSERLLDKVFGSD